jgi:polyvinyl alcohol dehydrogenase (cytochrome)
MALAFVSGALAGGSDPWPFGGQNLSSTRSVSQRDVGVGNVGTLAPKWTFTTHGDVSATAANSHGALYFPDWGGYLNKIDATTGSLIWQRQLSTYAGEPAGAVSRTSPAIVNGVVYIGDQNGAHLLAIDAKSGNLLWNTKINPHPLANITQSPVVYNGVVYIGAASLEEGAAANPAYPCCTFRGSFSAINAATGAILWTTYIVPDNNGQPGGYSGGGVWGGMPAINPASNTVFITTGNNYTVPQTVKDCEALGGTAASCLDPNDHIDSIIAINMSTGAIRWATGVQGFDDWNVACIPGFDPNNCPVNPGPDYDFGAGASLFTIPVANGSSRLAVGAGQKSGIYWALDAATGAIIWSQAAGPGSTLGGIEWGTATDSKHIYIAEANFFGIPYQLPSGQTITSGSFAALDPATGRIIWQVADPSGNVDLGPLSTSNGIVYAPSMSGHMYALDGATGNVLWDYLGAGSAIGGASIGNDGVVYWGNGYNHLGIPGFTPSTTFYAFSLNGK